MANAIRIKVQSKSYANAICRETQNAQHAVATLNTLLWWRSR